MIHRNRIVSAMAALILVSCTAVGGPRPIIDDRGPIVPRPMADARDASGRIARSTTCDPARAHDPDLVAAFESATICASNDATYVPRMRDAAYSLVYARCDMFFTAAARNQIANNVLSDVITSLSALSTGALALIHFKNDTSKDRIVAALALGGAAANSIIDINTRNFLFGAENIDSVRDLTLRALVRHSADINALHDDVGFDAMVINIVNHQNICTPRHIALLVKQAISAGRFEEPPAGAASPTIDVALMPQVAQ